jgi:hypothetical protein
LGIHQITGCAKTHLAAIGLNQPFRLVIAAILLAGIGVVLPSSTMPLTQTLTMALSIS